MQDVHFSIANALTDEVVQSLVTECPNLTALSFEGYPVARSLGASVSSLSNSALTRIWKHGAKLVSLHVNVPDTHFEENSIFPFHSFGRSIENVTFISTTEITTKIIDVFAGRFPNLRSITLGPCSYLKPEDFKVLEERCSQLERVTIHIPSKSLKGYSFKRK